MFSESFDAFYAREETSSSALLLYLCPHIHEHCRILFSTFYTDDLQQSTVTLHESEHYRVIRISDLFEKLSFFFLSWNRIKSEVSSVLHRPMRWNTYWSYLLSCICRPILYDGPCFVRSFFYIFLFFLFLSSLSYVSFFPFFVFTTVRSFLFYVLSSVLLLYSFFYMFL
jgi:hypothetical protein